MNEQTTDQDRHEQDEGDPPVTVLSGTWYRLAREIPDLERLRLLARALNRYGVRRCRYRIWAFLFEREVAELVGYHSGRNRDAWDYRDIPGSLGGRLDATEYDLVRATIMGELPPCPRDCGCRERHERLSTPSPTHPLAHAPEEPVSPGPPSR